MLISPETYHEHSAYDLLEAASHGLIGFDQRLLHALLDEPSRSLPDIVRWSQTPHPDAELNLADELVLVFRHLKTPEAIPFFIQYLRRSPDDVSDDAVDALFAIRHAALEPLLELYGELEEEESGEVAFILAAFRIHDPRVLKIIEDRLDFDAFNGAIALGLYGDPQALPKLQKLLGELGEEDEHLRRTIEESIQDVSRAADDVEPAWSIWEEFDEKRLPEVELLSIAQVLELFESEDPELRLQVAMNLGNRELAAESVQKLLAHARTDESLRVRSQSWQSLADLSTDAEIASQMKACIEDSAVPTPVRAGALAAMATELGKEELHKYAELFYKDRESRATALKAMWQSMDRSFSRFFPEHLADVDPEIRKQAISGIGYLEIASAVPTLRTLIEDPEYRANALFAYALAVPHEVTRGRVRSIFRKVEDAAGGLDEEESYFVEMALDERLLLHGHRPVFHPGRFEDLEEEVDFEGTPESTGGSAAKVGRNDPCPCGSGKKFKKCCGETAASPTKSSL